MRIRSKAFLALRDAYLRKHAPGLYGPGVTLTAEQEAAALFRTGQTIEAQRIIPPSPPQGAA